MGPLADQQTPPGADRAPAVMLHQRPGRRQGLRERRRLPAGQWPLPIWGKPENRERPPAVRQPVAAVESGRGGAGPRRLGRERASEVGEDGAHDGQVVDGGDNAHAATTAWIDRSVLRSGTRTGDRE